MQQYRSRSLSWSLSTLATRYKSEDGGFPTDLLQSVYSSKFFPFRCALSPLLLTMRQSISDDLSAFSHRNRGLAYAVLAEAFGTAMNAVVQLLEARYETPKAIHSLTILFLRMSLTAVFTSAGVWYRGVPILLVRMEHDYFSFYALLRVFVASWACTGV